MSYFYKELFSITLCFILFMLIVPIIILTDSYHDGTQRFDMFVKIFNKSYHQNVLEYDRRLRIFQQSLSKIKKLNEVPLESNLSAVYGITSFADLPLIEFKEKHLKLNSMVPIRSNRIPGKKGKHSWRNFSFVNGTKLKSSSMTLPMKVDWREKGIISAVRNQGSCGECWVHSVLAEIESMLAIKNSTMLKDLSVQQMIDCSGKSEPCAGGDTCLLLNWLYTNQINILTVEEYSHQPPDDDNAQKLCQMIDDGTYSKQQHEIKIHDYSCDNFSDNEHDILLYLAYQGPVIAAFNALPWQFYMNGIIQYNCDDDYKNLNHAAQIVGYDLTGEIPFYIIKNSWGTSFGDHGYLKLEIGKNLCGVANKVSTVIV